MEVVTHEDILAMTWTGRRTSGFDVVNDGDIALEMKAVTGTSI